MLNSLNSIYSNFHEPWTTTNGVSHPLRNQPTPGTLYERFAKDVQKNISFRTIKIDEDLKEFHQWQNLSRVAKLWELNFSMERLREYLETAQRDKHLIPLMVEVNGERAGYFEIYWALEDRLGPYYDALPYDRGFHFLIGNNKFLGTQNTKAIVTSLMHFLFQDEPRTQRIVAEPKSDNALVLRYAHLIPGWKIIKEFDFPHKRATLVMASREDFFKGALL